MTIKKVRYLKFIDTFENNGSKIDFFLIAGRILYLSHFGNKKMFSPEPLQIDYQKNRAILEKSVKIEEGTNLRYSTWYKFTNLVYKVQIYGTLLGNEKAWLFRCWKL